MRFRIEQRGPMLFTIYEHDAERTEIEGPQASRAVCHFLTILARACAPGDTFGEDQADDYMAGVVEFFEAKSAAADEAIRLAEEVIRETVVEPALETIARLRPAKGGNVYAEIRRGDELIGEIPQHGCAHPDDVVAMVHEQHGEIPVVVEVRIGKVTFGDRPIDEILAPVKVVSPDLQRTVARAAP